MAVTDDLDLTRSSDTTSEDVESPTSAYEEAMLQLEQLSVDTTGMFSSHFVFSCVSFKTQFLCAPRYFIFIFLFNILL